MRNSADASVASFLIGSMPRIVVGVAASALCLMMGCTTGAQPQDGGEPETPGPEAATCNDVSECPDTVNYDCLGVCLQKCAADDVCRAEEYCSNRGYCEAGCRNSTTCEAGFVCNAGACVSSGNAGSCGSKCDCSPGEVCTGGVCQPPPDECNGPADCGRGPGDNCEAFQCNGFTRQCFDPDPQPCSVAADCVGRPGCTTGCSCTPGGQCVPEVDCTVADEATTCGQGFYCNDSGTCDVAPSCTGDADCAAAGLTCNEGLGVCERAQPCQSNADCTTPPATYCNLDATPPGCEAPNCNNGGVTCNPATETCTADGRCIPQGNGDTCSSDAECSAAPWPDTEYCSFASGNGGVCASGCRTNANCPSGQICNGGRQCVADNGGGTLGQNGDSCSDTVVSSDCQAGLICTLLGTCRESCAEPGPCNGGADCCPLTGGDCEAGIFLNFCE